TSDGGHAITSFGAKALAKMKRERDEARTGLALLVDVVRRYRETDRNDRAFSMVEDEFFDLDLDQFTDRNETKTE
ncbi:hypothetical protein KAU11_06565, partial [Candidatus Babeliales bacterium]|nr:hypothetical protein [Candidatus Babeliales bacterium]